VIRQGRQAWHIHEPAAARTLKKRRRRPITIAGFTCALLLIRLIQEATIRRAAHRGDPGIQHWHNGRMSGDPIDRFGGQLI
jgi:hypothetical protein